MIIAIQREQAGTMGAFGQPRHVGSVQRKNAKCGVHDRESTLDGVM